VDEPGPRHVDFHPHDDRAPQHFDIPHNDHSDTVHTDT
jgi:hypothetical protein